MTTRRATRWLALSLAAAVLAGGCGRATRPAPRPATPERIVSLTLATDEMLAALVPPGRVVGVTALADDPGVSNVPGVYPGTTRRLREANAEQIIALRPDLVCVAGYNTADSLRLLERAGLSIYRNESVHTIAEVEAGLVRLGDRVGAPARARAVVGRMRDRLHALEERLKGEAHRPRVLYWSAGYTSGKGSTIDDIIRAAGGVNVAAELGLEGSAEIAPERVVAADPEFVLVSRWEADVSQGQVENHPILRRLPAVRAGRVLGIESRYVTAVSQYVVDGAERLARALHPGRFAAEGRP
jgi:iron complex transport system substrate-binding protein